MKDPHRNKLAARAAQAVFKTVKYRPEQEHLVRRLGEALVVQWDALPDELQDLPIDQASVVEGREEAAHQIENFIRGARVVGIAKPAAAREA